MYGLPHQKLNLSAVACRAKSPRMVIIFRILHSECRLESGVKSIRRCRHVLFIGLPLRLSPHTWLQLSYCALHTRWAAYLVASWRKLNGCSVRGSLMSRSDVTRPPKSKSLDDFIQSSTLAVYLISAGEPNQCRWSIGAARATAGMTSPTPQRCQDG